MATTINFSLAKSASKTYVKTPDFETLLTNDSNEYYKFSKDPAPDPSITMHHGKLVAMTIPPGFETLKNEAINKETKPRILSLLINIAKGKKPKVEEDHFCDLFQPEDRGTNCVRFMQKKSITYFKTRPKKVPFPNILNSPTYQAVINDYNSKYKNQPVYFLPTINPSNTIIYVVSNDEKAITELIAKYENNPQQEYFIPINGLIVPVDDWDTWLSFGTPTINFV